MRKTALNTYTDVEVSSWLFSLKYVTLTNTVTTVTITTIIIWIFEFCHNFEFGHNFRFGVLSQFDFWILMYFVFLRFVTIWVFESHKNLSIWVSSQFRFFSLVTIRVFCFVLSQLKFFLVLSHFEFLSFVTNWSFSLSKTFINNIKLTIY